MDGISFTVHPLGPRRPFDRPRAVGIGPDRHLTRPFSGSGVGLGWRRDEVLRGDLAARGTVAAALASKLAVVVSGVAVGRQAAAGTRAGGSVRERAPPGFLGTRCRRLAGAPRRAGEALSLGTRHYS